MPQVVIVVGASMGGVEALRMLAAGLPADLPAAVFVVLHIGAYRSELPDLLNRISALPVVHPQNGDTIQAGHIYIAPPDHHLTVEPGYMRLTKGPRENWARPAVDPLFRTAAHAYGTNVIGVILTGALNDGTAGLHEVKEQGGTTVVQSPADAVNAGMPRSAMAHVTIDHCLPLAGLPQLLVRLTRDKANAFVHRSRTSRPRGQEMTADYTHAQPVAITCPDCGGAVRRSELGSLTRFRCHIGHIYTAEVMMEAQAVAMERSLAAAMRALGERAELCRQMAERAQATEDLSALTHWKAANGEARGQAIALQNLLEKRVDAP